MPTGRSRRVHGQCWSDGRARPLLRPGRRFLGLPHARRGDVRPPASGQARQGPGAALALRFLGANRKNVAIRGGAPLRRAGSTDLARERPRQVAHRPPYLRARRLSQPLAGRGHGFRGAERQAEVRVPCPSESPRPGHQARLPRREAALARPGGEPANSAPPSASSPTRGRRAISSSPASACPSEPTSRTSADATASASPWAATMTAATRS